MLYQAGLVLEGGGMKGVYTAGVLDYFLDQGIDFAKCYGVSAGACHLCSYLSKQRGRAYAVVTDYLHDPDYWGISSLIRTGDLFNADMCYHRIPDSLNPFDYETYEKNPQLLSLVVPFYSRTLFFLPLRGSEKKFPGYAAPASGRIAG